MFGQRVLIDSDTGISISIDSTGYGEIHPTIFRIKPGYSYSVQMGARPLEFMGPFVC